MGRGKWFLRGIIVLIFLSPFLTLSFPHVDLPGGRNVDGEQLLSPLYAENSSAITSTIEINKGWSLSSPNPGIASLNNSTNSLSLTGTFPPSNQPSAVTIYRPLQISLTQYPILFASIDVSKGVGYGIRFYSQEASDVSLWGETDALDHRVGTGLFENIQVNMVQLVESNTARAINTLNEVRIYVERGSSASTTNFHLQLSKIEFLRYPFTSAQSGGRYHAIYFTLNRPQVSSSWVLQGITLEGRLSASSNTVYVFYLLDGLTVYRGSIFNYNPDSGKQTYTFTLPAQTMKAFPDALPTGDFSLVIVSASGTLYQFNLASITINYRSSVAETSSLPRPGTPDADIAVLGALLFLSVGTLLYQHTRKGSG